MAAPDLLCACLACAECGEVKQFLFTFLRDMVQSRGGSCLALLQLADNQKLINHVDTDAGRQVIPCSLLVMWELLSGRHCHLD